MTRTLVTLAIHADNVWTSFFETRKRNGGADGLGEMEGGIEKSQSDKI